MERSHACFGSYDINGGGRRYKRRGSSCGNEKSRLEGGIFDFQLLDRLI
jgi:hypothetical protein